MPTFAFQDILEAGHHGSTPYRKLTGDFVAPLTAGNRQFLEVAPEALTLLTKTAMRDIAHLLRPGHLAQLRAILDDKDASPNDHFVALELLKNANIAAGGILPGCQDTGTAIVMGKRGQLVLTAGNDEAAIARGVFDTYAEANLRYSQVAPLDMFEENNTGNNLPAQIELYATDGDEYHFLFMAKGGGSANKSLLFQETKALLNPASLTAFLDQKLRSLGTAACPPYHLAIVIGGTSAELALKTAKLASARYLDDLPTSGNALGRAFRDLEWEHRVLDIARATGIGAQFGGKYFCHDARVIRLPRHGASCPVAIAVSCSADRQALGKITRDGVFLEELERDPAKYLPDTTHDHLDDEAEVVHLDLNRPMAELREELTRYPVKTRLVLNGPMVVARDIAHAKIKERLDAGEAMPAYLRDHCVYYAGPAKTPEGYASGSFGPSTAGRLTGHAGQGQPLPGRDRRLRPPRRLLPRLDRRTRGAPRPGLHHQRRGARVPGAGDGGRVEDRGPGLPGLRRGRRQGQRLLPGGVAPGQPRRPPPLTGPQPPVSGRARRASGCACPRTSRGRPGAPAPRRPRRRGPAPARCWPRATRSRPAR
jgi:fumarate hydratase class I